MCRSIAIGRHAGKVSAYARQASEAKCYCKCKKMSREVATLKLFLNITTRAWRHVQKSNGKSDVHARARRQLISYVSTSAMWANEVSDINETYRVALCCKSNGRCISCKMHWTKGLGHKSEGMKPDNVKAHVP